MKPSHSKFIVLAFLLCTLVSAKPQSALGESYYVSGTIPFSSSMLWHSGNYSHLTECGQVLGWEHNGEEVSVYRWENGGVTQLASFGDSQTQVFDINSLGHTVGAIVPNPPSASNWRAFYWNPESGMSELGVLPGMTSSAACALNDKRHIVGVSSPTEGIYDLGTQTFYWTPENGMVDIGNPEFVYSGTRAWDMNNSGEFVGVAYFEHLGSEYPAFRWTPDLGFSPPLGGLHAQAFGINDQEQYVGYSGGPWGYIGTQATLWTIGEDTTPGDEGTYLGHLGPFGTQPDGSWIDPMSSARDINNLGQVVGTSRISTTGWEFHAFLWTEESEMVDLNDLIPLPIDSGWTLTNAYKINDKGQILADADGQALLLSPLIEVTTDQDYLIEMMLGEEISFDYWWMMGEEPPPYEGQAFDVFALQATEGWQFIGQIDAYESSTDWLTAVLGVPEELWGVTTQVRFVLSDYGPYTDRTVYMRNVGGVPEPATMLLLGTGLIGLAGLRRKFRKR